METSRHEKPRLDHNGIRSSEGFSWREDRLGPLLGSTVIWVRVFMMVPSCHHILRFSTHRTLFLPLQT
jgi:hypothetical protein